MAFTQGFNSQPILPKHKRIAIARGYRSNSHVDPGFEDFGESGSCKLAPGLTMHFDSTVGALPEDLVHLAVARGDYMQMAPLELRAE